MGDPEWAQRADFACLKDRLENIDSLHAEIATWTQGFDDRELADTLQAAGVAAAPVLNVADLLADPHYKARETFIEVTHPLGFKETIYGAYVKTSRTEASVNPGPIIGQDNDRVFKEILQMPEERYQELIAQEVIY
jgi:benzylsuccinate CoA-transferase BbsF subunit